MDIPGIGRHFQQRWRHASALALIVLIGGAGLVAASRQQSALHFEGEYGLWVSEGEFEVDVHWITRRAGTGFLRVLMDDAVLYGFETPTAFFHQASFPKVAAGPVTIQYGSNADVADQHLTVIELYDSPRPRDPIALADVDSLYVVGDVHGQFDTLVRLLTHAGLIDDDRLRWTGGRSHIVFLGNLFDSGADVIRTLWFLYGLQWQAELDGGGVHVVLGSHELMVLANDLTYVAGKEKLIAEYHGTTYPKMFDTRFSVLGKWLASKPGLLKVNDILLAHGGVTADYLGYSLESFDDSLSSYFDEGLFRRLSDPTAAMQPLDSAAVERRFDFFFGDNSVFWFRGYVESHELGDLLSDVLERFDSRLHVVSHTALPTIELRYAGSLIAVDLQRPATEMLLLVRTEDGYRRYRYGLEGDPEPL